jgi:hypothetical protein
MKHGDPNLPHPMNELLQMLLTMMSNLEPVSEPDPAPRLRSLARRRRALRGGHS